MNGALVVVAPRPGAPGALLGSLPAAERDRAGALHGDRRAEYVGGRVLARTLLAGELGCPPRDVPIVVDDAGRPRVAAGTRRPASRSASRTPAASSPWR
ncbi:hypothetical protein OHA72_37780 [Dactylosporangium sp. NBC_01737]|uniref:hypothetical protein n=1 Tax=Dactylosporangium sp. NBC_01737 TaxID=2975959 RepID=UPI002E120351|nr:hypothetical protein OHA72_37780 [Dactylosporangium sp. NBC_01737]